MNHIAEDYPRLNCYVVKLEGEREAFLRYSRHELNQQVLYLNHAEVPRDLRGKSYGAVLMEAVLTKIEDQNLKIIPICSYVQKYLKLYEKRWTHLIYAL